MLPQFRKRRVGPADPRSGLVDSPPGCHVIPRLELSLTEQHLPFALGRGPEIRLQLLHACTARKERVQCLVCNLRCGKPMYSAAFPGGYSDPISQKYAIASDRGYTLIGRQYAYQVQRIRRAHND